MSPPTHESWIYYTGQVLPYHNFNLPADVNDDGVVNPVDLQIIIDTLNAGGNLASAPFAFRDTNGDGTLTMDDMYTELRALNRAQATGFTISGPCREAPALT